MARVLTIKRTVVPQGERKKFLARLSARRDHYKRAGCSFWVCEEADLPGAFIEFTEATDARLLSAAHDGAPDPVFDAGRVYKEVEIA